jgi:hypothetical protein
MPTSLNGYSTIPLDITVGKCPKPADTCSAADNIQNDPLNLHSVLWESFLSQLIIVLSLKYYKSVLNYAAFKLFRLLGNSTTVNSSPVCSHSEFILHSCTERNTITELFTLIIRRKYCAQVNSTNRTVCSFLHFRFQIRFDKPHCRATPTGNQYKILLSNPQIQRNISAKQRNYRKMHINMKKNRFT